ncbi:Protein FAR1-RELATED SEQUENCE 3 [Bienertia sinuspersici]
MPLAPFVGVNHHGSSIIFTCALISHCMSKIPLGILIGQDKAIGKAVRIVFPEVALRVVVHECLDPVEFDKAWAVMVAKFNTGDKRKGRPLDIFDTTFGLECLPPREAKLYKTAMGDLANTEQKLNFASVDSLVIVDKTTFVEYDFHSNYTSTKFKEVRDEALGIRYTHVTKT